MNIPVALNHQELRALDKIFDKKPLHGDVTHFRTAMRKFRFGTATESAENLPELKAGCDYSLKWFKENKEQGKKIVQRYQEGVAAAERVYWSVRSGQ